MKRFLLLLPLFIFNQLPAEEPPVATFSIVAVDLETGEIGVAVQSKIVGVGAVVPFVRAGVGAVATQAYANVNYGPAGLLLLKSGLNPDECIKALTGKDRGRAHRQVGIVSSDGKSASFTGTECSDWAGGNVGQGFAVQGNILAGDEVVEAMAKAFEETEGILAERLLAALEAGQAAGGDKRGRQSAALLIARENWGYGGNNDRFRDIRVDEHPQPIKELRRVYEAHRRLFPRPTG